MPTGAVLTGLRASTQVPGARGAAATGPYVDNIFTETELSFHQGWFESFSPTIKKEMEISIDLTTPSWV